MSEVINIPIRVNHSRGVPLEELCLFLDSEPYKRLRGYCKKPPISYLRLGLLLFFSFLVINSTTVLFWYKVPQTSIPVKISKKLPVAAMQNIAFYQQEKETYPVKHDKDTVEIPSLHIEVPLLSAQAQDSVAVDTALKKGVIFYRDETYPNLPHNTVIAGHSTGEPWKSEYRFAFKDINKLTQGDTITLNYGNKRLTYSVVGQEIIDPQKNKNISEDTDKPYITLVTCWPLWTTEKRLLVKAELVNVESHVLLAEQQKLTPLD